MKFNNKIYNKIGMLFVAGVLLASTMSCKDEFLESYPENDLSAGTFYNTTTDFENSVNGIYRTLSEKIDEGDKEFTYAPMMDCGTPYAGAGKSRFGVWDHGLMNITSSWKVTAPYWKTYYRIINRSNEVLDQIEIAPEGLDQSLMDRFKGEALFLRSFAYFYLTNLYGDVPFHLTVPTVDEASKPRTAKSIIIEQIIGDLQTAITLLPSVKEYSGANVGKASKGSAQALLGKLFMFEERYGEAKQVLGNLINSGDYMLTPGPTGYIDQFWPDGDNNVESVFEIQYNTTDGSTFTRYCATQESKMHNKGYRYLAPRQDFLDKYETVNGDKVTSTFVEKLGDATHIYTSTSTDADFDPANPFLDRDPRLKWSALYEGTPYLEEFMSRTGQSGVTYLSSYTDDTYGGNYSTVKYVCGDTYDLTGSDSSVNYKVIRYADVLLLYGEALLEGDANASGCADYIDMIRSRESVNMPPVDRSGSLEDMRQNLRDERIRELAFEYGHIYLDLRRWGTYGDEMDAFWTVNKYGGNNPALSYDDNYLLWPIPQGEIDANGISQNPGY